LPNPSSGKARFTPTLNAYSFLEQLNANIADPKTGIDLFGVCDFCVTHDIEAVDLTGYFFPGYPNAPSDDRVDPPIAVAEFVTIIGIPFALKDLQLAGLALAPIGKTVVEKR
jgi:hypothetical protein